jgi:hypothetical protein
MAGAKLHQHRTVTIGRKLTDTLRPQGAWIPEPGVHFCGERG